jgi:hypothetical protein
MMEVDGDGILDGVGSTVTVIVYVEAETVPVAISEPDIDSRDGDTMMLKVAEEVITADRDWVPVECADSVTVIPPVALAERLKVTVTEIDALMSRVEDLVDRLVMLADAERRTDIE